MYFYFIVACHIDNYFTHFFYPRVRFVIFWLINGYSFIHVRPPYLFGCASYSALMLTLCALQMLELLLLLLLFIHLTEHFYARSSAAPHLAKAELRHPRSPEPPTTMDIFILSSYIFVRLTA